MKITKTDLMYTKIELDKDNYIYDVSSEDGFPYGTIKYYEPWQSFVFKPRESAELSVYDLRSILNFIVDNNLE